MGASQSGYKILWLALCPELVAGSFCFFHNMNIKKGRDQDALFGRGKVVSHDRQSI